MTRRFICLMALILILASCNDVPWIVDDEGPMDCLAGDSRPECNP